MSNLTDLEVDLLLLFYTFSDQHGRIDMVQCSNWARQKLGVILPPALFKISQKHLDILMDKGLVPDTRELFYKLKTS